MKAKTKEPKTRKETAASASRILAGNNVFSLISNEKLLSIYAAMLKCRMMEERMRLLFPQSKAAPMGREAAVAGVTIDLLPEDALIASPRDLIPALVKGVPLEALFCNLFVCAADPSAQSRLKPRSAPAHFTYEPLNVVAASTTIAAQLRMAIDLAKAEKARNKGRIAVIFSDGGSGAWLKALKLAGKESLPMLFVCQNSPFAKPAGHESQNLGFPSIPVDTNDAVAVYRVASESISLIRQGRGPTLIECKTYRLPDRSPKGLSRPRKTGSSEGELTGDPILSMESYLTRKGLFSTEFRRQVVAGFGKELDSAIAKS
jgi:TPP-dependent pyruvate/acetoin dehydrogenase alpha subunit